MTVIVSGSSNIALKLLTDTPEQQKAARALWDKYSGAAGMLDNRNGYKYRASNERYTLHSRLVTEKQLRSYISNVSLQAQMEMKKNTQQLISGTIILAVWYSRMQNLMESLYRTIWLVSIGGFLFDDDTQRNIFYLFVLTQFQYLDNFYYQLAHGLTSLSGLTMTRAGLYGAYGNGLYQNIGLESEIRAGATQARRVLGANEDHCHDSGEREGCYELALLGWMPINQMVPIGEAVCWSNCLCRIETR